MAGHAQLKFVMTECSKTQIRLAGLSMLVQGLAWKHRKTCFVPNDLTWNYAAAFCHADIYICFQSSTNELSIWATVTIKILGTKPVIEL